MQRENAHTLPPSLCLWLSTGGKGSECSTGQAWRCSREGERRRRPSSPETARQGTARLGARTLAAVVLLQSPPSPRLPRCSPPRHIMLTRARVCEALLEWSESLHPSCRDAPEASVQQRSAMNQTDPSQAPAHTHP